MAQGYVQQIHVVHGIDPEVGVVSEHGLPVEHFVVLAAGHRLTPAGPASPEFPAQSHDEKSRPGIRPHMLLAQWG